jgi:hypothetical protein
MESRVTNLFSAGSPVSRWSNSTIGFWRRVLGRTESHGFTKDQQFQIADLLRRKCIPLPSVKECKAAKAKAIEWNEAYPDFASPPEEYDVLIAFIRRNACSTDESPSEAHLFCTKKSIPLSFLFEPTPIHHAGGTPPQPGT